MESKSIESKSIESEKTSQSIHLTPASSELLDKKSFVKAIEKSERSFLKCLAIKASQMLLTALIIGFIAVGDAIFSSAVFTAAIAIPGLNISIPFMAILGVLIIILAVGRYNGLDSVKLVGDWKTFSIKDTIPTTHQSFLATFEEYIKEGVFFALNFPIFLILTPYYLCKAVMILILFPRVSSVYKRAEDKADLMKYEGIKIQLKYHASKKVMLFVLMIIIFMITPSLALSLALSAAVISLLAAIFIVSLVVGFFSELYKINDQLDPVADYSNDKKAVLGYQDHLIMDEWLTQLTKDFIEGNKNSINIKDDNEFKKFKDHTNKSHKKIFFDKYDKNNPLEVISHEAYEVNKMNDGQWDRCYEQRKKYELYFVFYVNFMIVERDNLKKKSSQSNNKTKHEREIKWLDKKINKFKERYNLVEIPTVKMINNYKNALKIAGEEHKCSSYGDYKKIYIKKNGDDNSWDFSNGITKIENIQRVNNAKHFDYSEFYEKNKKVVNKYYWRCFLTTRYCILFGCDDFYKIYRDVRRNEDAVIEKIKNKYTNKDKMDCTDYSVIKKELLILNVIKKKDKRHRHLKSIKDYELENLIENDCEFFFKKPKEKYFGPLIIMTYNYIGKGLLPLKHAHEFLNIKCMMEETNTEKKQEEEKQEGNYSPPRQLN